MQSSASHCCLSVTAVQRWKMARPRRRTGRPRHSRTCPVSQGHRQAHRCRGSRLSEVSPAAGPCYESMCVVKTAWESMGRALATFVAPLIQTFPHEAHPSGPGPSSTGPQLRSLLCRAGTARIVFLPLSDAGSLLVDDGPFNVASHVRLVSCRVRVRLTP
jgi:hypothetical protein